jgi:GNAT superfamily N-acetyltransferase
VLPDARRGGVGRALLAEVGGPMWTTTANAEAVPFYVACGWAVVAERAVADRPTLTCWTLRAD